MAEQAELDLPTPPSAHPVSAKTSTSGFAGLTPTQWIIGALVAAAVLWSMWVTKQLVTPHSDHIVSARLSSIVGEYVQAQARSASPPAQVEAEMRQFMGVLAKELERRSAKGQVVLVGEAVLTKNVPDITDDLKKAVYSSGIHLPRQASVEDLQRMQQQLASVQPTLAPAAPSASLNPMASAQALPAGSGDMASIAPTAAGADVSTFGGPNVGGDQ